MAGTIRDQRAASDERRQGGILLSRLFEQRATGLDDSDVVTVRVRVLGGNVNIKSARRREFAVRRGSHRRDRTAERAHRRVGAGTMTTNEDPTAAAIRNRVSQKQPERPKQPPRPGQAQQPRPSGRTTTFGRAPARSSGGAGARVLRVHFVPDGRAQPGRRHNVRDCRNDRNRSHAARGGHRGRRALSPPAEARARLLPAPLIPVTV